MIMQRNMLEDLEGRCLLAAFAVGSIGADIGASVAADRAGNYYVVGTFQGTVDFDPGAGVSNLSGGGGFVAKYASDGSLLWARKFKGVTPTDVATDRAGNVLVAGSFSGTVGFGSRSSVPAVVSAGGTDALLLKLSAAGDPILARGFGGAQNDVATAVAVGGDDNIAVGGTFEGRANFNPAGRFRISSSGGADGFIVGLDSDANFVWAGSFSGPANENLADLAMDGSGNVLGTGAYQGTVEFNPTTAVQNDVSVGGSVDAFVLKWTWGGGFAFAHGFGGVGLDFGASVATDRAANVYTLGNFTTQADLDPSGATFNVNGPGTGEIFVSKLDAAGLFVWGKGLGGAATNDVGPGQIAADKNQNVFLTGRYAGTKDFDPDGGVSNLVSTGLNDIFLTKLDSTGALAFAKSIGGAGADTPAGTVLDRSGNILMTGTFTGTANFATSGAAVNLTSNGDTDVFVAKYTAGGELA